MSAQYSVRCVRVTTAWFGTRKFYLPMLYNEISGKFFCVKDEDELPSMWGYDTEEEAWAIIDYMMQQDACEEYLDHDNYRYDSDREDFHADG